MRTDSRPSTVARIAAVLAALALALGPAAPGFGAGADNPAVSGAAADATIGPVNYTVAVDESGSITASEMASERDAAARIALGNVSPASQVSVFGFASADNASETPVDVDCTPTLLDAAGRGQIGQCAGRLKSRTPSQGQGTDFPNAIRQGISYVSHGTDPSTPRVLFILTDGMLDVTTSPEYGSDPTDRQAEGYRQLTSVLAQAAAAHVQVWALGIGPQADMRTLDEMSSSGYQGGCVDLPAARPAAVHVTDAASVGTALETAFADANCLRSGTVATGYPPTDLTVAISPLATVGSIIVAKGDPAVTVTYFDPQHHQVPSDGSYEGSTFELAGAGQTVEALRITDPLPGNWTVHLAAPPGHRGTLASVNVLWRGELSGSVTMDPPSPTPGQQVVATLRLQTRQGYTITDPREYAGLTVSAVLSGSGFLPVPITLADNGVAPDLKAGDGAFTGYVTIPQSATGALRVTGTLTAVGLTADAGITASGLVAAASPLVSVSLSLGTGTVHPGDRVSGVLSVHNADQVPHTLQLTVQNVDGTLLSLSPSRLVLKPGESDSRAVALVVGPRSAFGPRLGPSGLVLGGTAAVIDTTDHGRVLSQTPLSLTVRPRPGFWTQWWWAFVAGAALLAVLAAAAVGLWRRWVSTVEAQGIELTLIAEDGKVIGTHPARGGGPKGWYEFEVVEATGPHPRVMRRPDGPFAVRRHRDGGAVLRSRSGVRGRTRLRTGNPVPLVHGLSLSLGEPSADTAPPRGKDKQSTTSSGPAAPIHPDL